ncbi:hypothetical protein F4775DRAFT_225415 [Biscogniauxia sp. FL1348]|nr:hypothetical protein F4775DRAFT_225415 [Biscogniauxia sp. FL1348]
MGGGWAWHDSERQRQAQDIFFLTWNMPDRRALSQFHPKGTKTRQTSFLVVSFSVAVFLFLFCFPFSSCRHGGEGRGGGFRTPDPCSQMRTWTPGACWLLQYNIIPRYIGPLVGRTSLAIPPFLGERERERASRLVYFFWSFFLFFFFVCPPHGSVRECPARKKTKTNPRENLVGLAHSFVAPHGFGGSGVRVRKAPFALGQGPGHERGGTRCKVKETRGKAYGTCFLLYPRPKERG